VGVKKRGREEKRGQSREKKEERRRRRGSRTYMNVALGRRKVHPVVCEGV
jgi:hypothetical protein